MDVQVDLNRVLEMTRQRLTTVTSENVVLHCVVEQQEEELTKLRLLIDKLGEGVQGAENEEH